MSTLVNIITEVSKPENLEFLQESLLEASGSLPIQFQWYLLCDKELDKKLKIPITYITAPTSKKNGRINAALDQINEGFVYFLREDNLMHPELLKEFDFSSDGMIVEQILEDAGIRPIKVQTPNSGGFRYPKIKPGSIDAAQYLLSRKVIGGERWHLGIDDADGYFIESIYDKNAKSIKLVEKPLAYYKKLNEYYLLRAAPKTFQAGSIVVPDKEYFETHIKGSLNPILRTTLTLLSRCVGRKFKVLDISETVINILPLRTACTEYRRGKGVLLIFETPEHLKNCFKLLEWPN